MTYKFKCIVLLFCLSCQLCHAGLNDLFNFKLKNEYDYKSAPLTPKVPKTFFSEINIAIAGNINLYVQKENQIYYPLISELKNSELFKIENFDNNTFIKVQDKQAQDIIKKNTVIDPDFNDPILYKESVLILQDFLSAQLDEFKKSNLDLVFFSGNQVYSNNQLDYFYANLVEFFDKYQVPHFELIGNNERMGQKDINKEIKDPYYLLQVKGLNIIVLDNQAGNVIPQVLPYEASEQYLWLERVMKKLNKENQFEDLCIISFKKPSTKLINYINQFNNLKLIAFIYGEDESYSSSLINNTKVIATPSLSKYPLSYLEINRDKTGFYKFQNKQLDLPGMQELAQKKLNR